ncbi:Rieske (2Fe-2S) protein [Paludibacterium yongneupense]|uniref:Rieske (2Fe-2S) protein n=1 Tax=Paludibacterium yongneupense TaxID=400061 RepID=UPI00041470A7|nr:Rieske 2Fe-2S domain-containing protein [Paludibacterium yongneupense]
MAAESPVLICPSSALIDSGRAVRFRCEADGQAMPAFAIRHGGRVYAYINACRHIPLELDCNEGDIFDLSGHYLICSMHGARYEADSGYCVYGPCRGSRLRRLTVQESDGMVYLIPDSNDAALPRTGGSDT